MADERVPVELHIVSDSTGETAQRLVLALEAQFPDQPFEEIRHPRVENVEDLHIAVQQARGRPAVMVYTLVEPGLRDAMRQVADIPLDQAMRRDHASLTQMDVAKGMALYLWWRSKDPAALKTFFDALRDTWPSADPPPSSPPAVDAVKRAFIAAFKQPLEACDPELRNFVMKTMRD